MEYIRDRHVPARYQDGSGQSPALHASVLRRGDQQGGSHASFPGLGGDRDPEARADISRKEIEYSKAISLFRRKGDLLELRRRGFLLGMITNSYQSAAEKASWFRALGLDCIAERVVSSIDAGVSKPDKGIYLEFARRVGLSRGNCLRRHEAPELREPGSGNAPYILQLRAGNQDGASPGEVSDLLDLFPSPVSTASRP